MSADARATLARPSRDVRPTDRGRRASTSTTRRVVTRRIKTTVRWSFERLLYGRVHTPRGEIKTHATPRGKGIVSPAEVPEGLTHESRLVDPPSHPKDVHPSERREATPLDGRPRTRARGSAPSPPTTDIMSFVSASARAHVSVVAKATTAKKSSATTVAAPKAKIASAIDRVKLPALALAAQATALVPAAHAEAGKLFDFDLTLPIIATEFLLLMTILDKTVFGPVGKALDDRDELIRSQLAAVGDNSSEVEGLIVRARSSLLFFARARRRTRGAREGGRARKGIEPIVLGFIHSAGRGRDRSERASGYETD